MNKSTPQELREQFNRDVERFVNAETGQVSTQDAALALDLMEKALPALTPHAQNLCDVGCGGGNFAVRVLRAFPKIQITLLDLSPNMLERAAQRITQLGGQVVRKEEGDIREIELPPQSQDIITAAAVLHHLRTRSEWESVLSKLYQALRPGGTFWLWDLIKYDNANLQALQMQRYGEYLTQQKDEEYKNEIFKRIEQSDTPESSSFLMQTLHKVGFSEVDIVHKNTVFCALYGKKIDQ